MQYVFIGDKHGRADKLEPLLKKLGFTLRDGAYWHPFKIAVFCGDIIDRGAHQVRTYRIVRAMVDAGNAIAIMGNHEFNAIAYYLIDPKNTGRYLREHNQKNRHQHEAFLSEVEHDPSLYKEIIEWFLELPLWVEHAEFRAAHACWDQEKIDLVSPMLAAGNKLTINLMPEACSPGSILYEAVESITKGPEVALPEGFSYLDPDGNVRKRSRTKWWDANAIHYKTALIIAKGAHVTLPEAEIPHECRITYDNAKPLFIGHYWMTGKPRLLSNKIACVDYSAAKGGDLMAYCWDGESDLREDRFFSSGMDASLAPPSLRRQCS